MTFELTIWQLGEELALAIATGLFLGIAVGIKLYERYGADSKRTTGLRLTATARQATSAANLPRTATSKLGSCLEVR